MIKILVKGNILKKFIELGDLIENELYQQS